MSKDKIFNRAALDKLRSPEKLDTMIRVTNPVGWMGLVSLCILVFAIVLWSFLGSFTERADGAGLLLDSAGVVNVSHAASGKLTDVYVKTGDIVHEGEVIAHMEQPELSADTRMARYGADIAWSKSDVRGRVYEYDAKRQQQAAREDIISAYDGVVDEVMAEAGNIISAGSPICTVRLTQSRDEMKGVFYVPVDKGKRIRPGMVIQLAPNGVDTTQTGSLVGVVRSVSQYPISAEGVNKGVGNAQFAKYILTQKNGAAMEVRFDLVKDADSKSGYLWTSVIGKDKPPITPGSYCTGFIVIDSQPPIEKVFYKISDMLRSR
ncbi:MAG: HlyD family efflux transporter periplasmic adaptor subunit [Selenomonadaceae bacterium]|nr:HlyD family efflux transporter periplasmic adaptor subunit [Selenomonadaceae bacterium]